METKKILQISGGVSVQKLYNNIFKLFSLKGCYQWVYVPCNTDDKVGVNAEDIENVIYFYDVIKGKLARLLFFPKANRFYRCLTKRMEVNQIDFCFAYTVMTDGSVALKLKQNFGIRYSVFVRNTDLNFFYKYFIFLRPLFFRILINADFINFPNPSYQKRLVKILPEVYKKAVIDKCKIVPNGIDDFWHQNRLSKKKARFDDKLNFIFVGKIDSNKNLATVVKALKILNRTMDIRLTIVGNVSKDMLNEFNNWLIEFGDFIDYKGEIYEKPILLKLYQQADVFIMPSITETFGLVYIEALTQGVPIIYTKDEGVDGFFENGTVGYALENPLNPNEILEAINLILKKYDSLSASAVEESKRFNWNIVINEYLTQFE